VKRKHGAVAFHVLIKVLVTIGVIFFLWQCNLNKTLYYIWSFQGHHEKI